MAPAATPHGVLRCSRHAPGHLSRARRLVSGRFRTLPGAPPPHAPRPRPAAFRCGQPSPAPGFRSHGRSCSVWLPLSETSCSPPVGREQQDSSLPFRGRWRRVAHTPRLFFIRPPAGGRCERGGRGPLPEAVVSFPSDPYPGRASWVGRGSSLSFSEETPHRPPAWLRYGDASSAPSSLSFLVALRVRTPILCAPLVVITTVLPSVAELSAWGKRRARAGGL